MTPCTHQYRLEADWLESIFTEKDLAVLVDNKLNIPKELHCQKTEGVGLSLYSALVRPYLECSDQFGAFQYKKDMDLLSSARPQKDEGSVGISGGETLEEVAQRVCGVSILGNIQQPTGHSPGQSALPDPALSKAQGLFLNSDLILPDAAQALQKAASPLPVLLLFSVRDESEANSRPSKRCGGGPRIQYELKIQYNVADFLSRHYGTAKNSQGLDKKNKSLLYNIINQTLLQEGQAKQPQLPQPLLLRLVLQTLQQLRCPSLDTLQHLNVFLVVGGPKLNTVFELVSFAFSNRS
ncbi:hypothetical protein QYF61_027215 [Mycteria americana]|uniref:Uncharacterized protein n=1 Tax=Mycteria americana TaxID=33587 RepID=A0AAN7NN35_MYCAM|nr:hypothetical protein QYF61_027215 [Mycteria americana]